MKLKPKKDWTDAIRESYSSDVGAPDAVGWDAIERRLHRSVVLRRSAIAAAIAAAVLLPLSVLLIRSPWQKSLPPTENNVANSGSSPVVPPSGEASGDTIFIAAADSPEAVTPATSPAARRSASVQPGQPGQSIQNDLHVQPNFAEESTVDSQPSQPAGGNASAPDSTARKAETPAEKPAHRQIQELIPEDLLAFAEDEPQQRRNRKVSVAVSAGAGAAQRNMMLNTMSAPYLAKLANMNYGYTEGTALYAYRTAVKINSANIDRQYYNYLLTKAALKASVPNPSTPGDVQYRHDLPLSFGLLTRVGLLPWLGAVWNIPICIPSQILISALLTSGSILSVCLSGWMQRSGPTICLKYMLLWVEKQKNASLPALVRSSVKSPGSNGLPSWPGVSNTISGTRSVFTSSRNYPGI